MMDWHNFKMYSHAPVHYRCPFCAIAAGQEVEYAYTIADDIVLHTDHVTGFISSHWWPRNQGHVILIPNAHYENIYTLPDDLGAALFRAARRVALALKLAYGCEGISTRQHNEPGGMQEVWHFHFHVFPRYYDDGLYIRTPERFMTNPCQRRPYAEKVRAALQRMSNE